MTKATDPPWDEIRVDDDLARRLGLRFNVSRKAGSHQRWETVRDDMASVLEAVELARSVDAYETGVFGSKAGKGGIVYWTSRHPDLRNGLFLPRYGPPLEEAARQGLEAAAARGGVELLLVFGSFARGEAGDGSDLDLGVLFGPRGAPPVLEQLALADELQRFVERDVDLVVLDDAPPLLRHEAARGEPLYQGRAGAFADFAARALFDLEDVRPYLRRTARGALRGAPA